MMVSFTQKYNSNPYLLQIMYWHWTDVIYQIGTNLTQGTVFWQDTFIANLYTLIYAYFSQRYSPYQPSKIPCFLLWSNVVTVKRGNKFYPPGILSFISYILKLAENHRWAKSCQTKHLLWIQDYTNSCLN